MMRYQNIFDEKLTNPNKTKNQQMMNDKIRRFINQPITIKKKLINIQLNNLNNNTLYLVACKKNVESISTNFQLEFMQ